MPALPGVGPPGGPTSDRGAPVLVRAVVWAASGVGWSTGWPNERSGPGPVGGPERGSSAGSGVGWSTGWPNERSGRRVLVPRPERARAGSDVGWSTGWPNERSGAGWPAAGWGSRPAQASVGPPGGQRAIDGQVGCRGLAARPRAAAHCRRAARPRPRRGRRGAQRLGRGPRPELPQGAGTSPKGRPGLGRVSPLTAVLGRSTVSRPHQERGTTAVSETPSTLR